MNRPAAAPTTLAAQIGPALARLREQAGLTQVQLAFRLTESLAAVVPQAYVSKVENGHTRVSWSRLEAFCAALGCRPSDVVLLAERQLAAPPPPAAPAAESSLNAAQLAGLTQEAARRYGVFLTEAQARQVGADPGLAPEIAADGDLDTYARDCLAAALIDYVLPGPPAATDELLGERQDHWHWPLNGSSPDYCRAFYRAFRAAARAQGVRLRPRFPG